MKHPEQLIYGSVHRFFDDAVLFVGTSERQLSVRLSPVEARATAETLLKFADDIDARGFLESTLRTTEIVDSE